jgi:hypothetical protein
LNNCEAVSFFGLSRIFSRFLLKKFPYSQSNVKKKTKQTPNSCISNPFGKEEARGRWRGAGKEKRFKYPGRKNSNKLL